MVNIDLPGKAPYFRSPSSVGHCHVSRGFSRQKTPAEPTARPVELHSDLYREIFAHSKEAIAIIDPEGFYLQQNGAHFTLLGYDDDDLEGNTPAFYLGEQTFNEIFKHLVAAGDYSGEHVCRTKNGEERNIDLSVFTMRSGLGEPLCYVSINARHHRAQKDRREVGPTAHA